MGPKGAGFFADAITWKILDKKTPQKVAVDINTKLLEGKYIGPVRGLYSHSLKVTSISNGLIIQHEGEKEADTLNTYIGNNTWADGNTKIRIVLMDHLLIIYFKRKLNNERLTKN
jgi:hypothetical protein